MRSTLSTIAAAFVAIGVLVFGGYAWGKPSHNSLTSAPTPAASVADDIPALPETVVPSPAPQPDTSSPPAPSTDTGSAAADGTQIATATTYDGYEMATGQGSRFGADDAPLWFYTVEVHPDLRAELPTLLSVTDSALGNPDQGWTSQGERSLQRTDDINQAAIRIVLAPAAVVDQECARGGLDTVGYYSCWNGQQTMLNADRWFGATADFNDLNVYRHYLVNHEFGHGLGYQHEYCPAAGAPAPVMAQQSMGLGACVANGWPYP